MMNHKELIEPSQIMDKPDDFCGWIETPEDKPMSKDALCDRLVWLANSLDRTAHPDADAINEAVILLRASPPVDGLVERLRGCAIIAGERDPIYAQSVEAIEQLTATLADRDATIERQDRALGIARKEIVELACVGTEKLRDLGLECDPPQRTYTPILDRIDAALDASATDHD